MNAVTERQRFRFSSFLKQLNLKQMKENFKLHGFKGLIRIYGWKLVAAVFVYYLIRDSILYILIPWLIARQFMNS